MSALTTESAMQRRATNQVATFYVDRLLIGIQISQVQEINRQLDVTPVPARAQVCQRGDQPAGRCCYCRRLATSAGLASCGGHFALPKCHHSAQRRVDRIARRRRGRHSGNRVRPDRSCSVQCRCRRGPFLSGCSHAGQRDCRFSGCRCGAGARRAIGRQNRPCRGLHS